MADMSNSTPAILCKNHLVADGRSSVFTGWTFKFGQITPDPDQLIVLIDQADRPSMPHLALDYLGLQVLVRGVRGGDGYQSGYLMVRNVRDVLLGLCGHPTEFQELWGITERTGITPIGYDDRDRHIWSWNARLIVEPAGNSLTNRVSM